MDKEHAINSAKYRARNPRNYRAYGGGAVRVYYVLETHPLPCTGRPDPDYMITTWLGTHDEEKDVIGYASTRDGKWHPRNRNEQNKPAPSGDLRAPQTLSQEPSQSVAETGMLPVAPPPPDASSQAPEHAAAAPPTPKRGEDQSPRKSGPSGHPSVPGATLPGQPGSKPERDPQVRLSGEVKGVSYREPKQPGKAPSLQLTVASQEGEEMRFTRVYTTKQRAQQYKDVAQIGDRVDIVGLAQQQTRRLPDGSERQETVVYALGIKKVTPEGKQS